MPHVAPTVSMFRKWFAENYCHNSSIMANYEQYFMYWKDNHPTYPPVRERWFEKQVTKYLEESHS